MENTISNSESSTLESINSSSKSLIIILISLLTIFVITTGVLLFLLLQKNPTTVNNSNTSISSSETISYSSSSQIIANTTPSKVADNLVSIDDPAYRITMSYPSSWTKTTTGTITTSGNPNYVLNLTQGDYKIVFTGKVFDGSTDTLCMMDSTKNTYPLPSQLSKNTVIDFKDSKVFPFGKVFQDNSYFKVAVKSITTNMFNICNLDPTPYTHTFPGYFIEGYTSISDWNSSTNGNQEGLSFGKIELIVPVNYSDTKVNEMLDIINTIRGI